MHSIIFPTKNLACDRCATPAGEKACQHNDKHVIVYLQHPLVYSVNSQPNKTCHASIQRTGRKFGVFFFWGGAELVVRVSFLGIRYRFVNPNASFCSASQ